MLIDPALDVDTIFSDHRGEAGFLSLLQDFAQAANERRASLIDHFEAGRLVELQATARELRGSGAGFGFPRLAELAAELEQACAAELRETAVIGRKLDRVLACLSRIHA